MITKPQMEISDDSDYDKDMNELLEVCRDDQLILLNGDFWCTKPQMITNNNNAVL